MTRKCRPAGNGFPDQTPENTEDLGQGPQQDENGRHDAQDQPGARRLAFAPWVRWLDVPPSGVRRIGAVQVGHVHDALWMTARVCGAIVVKPLKVVA